MSWSTQGLIVAAQTNTSTYLFELIKRGADVNVINQQGETALMWTATNGESNSTILLLQSGAYIDAVDNTGKSALIWAIINRHHLIVQILLSFRANPYLVDLNGFNAFDYARKPKNKIIIRLLTNAQPIYFQPFLLPREKQPLPILRKRLPKPIYSRIGQNTIKHHPSRTEVFDQLIPYQNQRVSVSGTIQNFHHPGSVQEVPRQMITLSPVTIAGITVDHVNIRLRNKLREIDDQLIVGKTLIFDGIVGVYDQNKINVDGDPQNIIVK